MAIAVNVNTETFTLSACTKGQKPHINHGNVHRCSRAAWNWNGEGQEYWDTAHIQNKLKWFNENVSNIWILLFHKRIVQTYLKRYAKEANYYISKCQVGNVHIGDSAHLSCGSHHPYNQGIANNCNQTNATIE